MQYAHFPKNERVLFLAVIHAGTPKIRVEGGWPRWNVDIVALAVAPGSFASSASRCSG